MPNSRAFAMLLVLVLAVPSTFAGELIPDQSRQGEAFIAQSSAKESAAPPQADTKITAAEAEKTPGKLVERRIRDLGVEVKVPDHALSFQRTANGEGWAYILETKDKRQVVHNGREGPAYRLIQTLVLSGDGRRVAYTVEVKGPPWEYFVVSDGVEGRKYAYVTDLTFSPDGRHLAYIALRGESWVIVRDGVEVETGVVRAPREWGRHPEIVDNPNDPRLWGFSPDGQHLLWVIRRDRSARAVIDGIPGPPHELLWRREVLKDAVHFVAVDKQQGSLVSVEWPREGQETLLERTLMPLGEIPAGGTLSNFGLEGDNRIFVVRQQNRDTILLDGRAMGTYDRIVEWHFSPRRDHVWFLAERGQERLLAVDDAAFPVDPAGTNRPTFSPDGEHWAFSSRREGKFRMAWDRQEGLVYDRVMTGPVFSPDGNHLAYGAGTGEEYFVVRDGQPLTRYKDGCPICRGIYGLTYSPDSRHIAYSVVYNVHRGVIRLDDKELGTLQEGTVEQFAFSPDSVHLAYAAGGVVICDGRRGEKHDGIWDLAFSEDGRHLHYFARRDRKSFLVCDGMEGPEHDNIRLVPAPAERARTLQYMAVDADRKTLVEVAWPKDLDWTNGLKAAEPPQEQ